MIKAYRIKYWESQGIEEVTGELSKNIIGHFTQYTINSYGDKCVRDILNSSEYELTLEDAKLKVKGMAEKKIKALKQKIEELEEVIK
jgi:hypothetical protein